MGLNRLAAKRDANEREIIDALRKMGARVWQQASPCDLLIGYCGEWVTMEVKDGSKPPSARRLTDLEQEFLDICQDLLVPHYVVTSAEQAVEVLISRRGRSH